VARWKRIALLVGLAVLGPSCTTIEGELLPGAAPPAAPAGDYRVGTSKVDITPSPGYPMGGFSIGGQVGRGVWHRLWARAVYIQDRSGTELVLVSCDLPFLPGGLGDRVAELVRQTPGTASISREQIVLAATHTHHGPGNFVSNSFYNGFGSCDPGYDPVLFDFLADRMAKGIVAAASRPEPARLSYGAKRVGGLSMNESLPAFLRNPESQQILAENSTLDLGGTPESCHPADSYRAIDPTLAVLRVTRASDPKHTIALLSFFSVHPTTLGPPLPLYDSDLFGVACTLIEQSLARDQGTGSDGVACIFNGAEGDVITTSTRQDREDLEAEGERLSREVLGLAQNLQPGTLTGSLGYRCKRYPFPKNPEPMFGAPVMGGAENGRSFLYDLGWREYLRGNPQHPVPGQGTKLSPLEPLQAPFPTLGLVETLLKDVTTLPKQAWIGVYQIGPNLSIATLPGEFTMTMGRRICRALGEPEKTSPDPAPKVLLVGLANEYVASFAAPEEHDAQAYSGASMAYGREAAMKVKDFIAELAKSPPEPPRTNTLGYSYVPGPTAHFGMDRIRLGSIRSLSDVKHVEPFLYSLKDVIFARKECTVEVRVPFTQWISEDPAWPPTEGISESPIPRVTIERHKDGCWGPLLVNAIPEDNQGTRLISLAWGLPEEKTAWTMIWLAPATAVVGTDSLRFSIETHGKTFHSRHFTLEDLAKHEDGYVPMRLHEK
jgi:neutral ceramidase